MSDQELQTALQKALVDNYLDGCGNEAEIVAMVQKCTPEERAALAAYAVSRSIECKIREVPASDMVITSGIKIGARGKAD